MRKRLSSAAFLLLALPLGAMALVSACGGDNAATDAGADATVDAKPDVAKLEAGPDVLDASTCPDVDLIQYLPSSDASIDVDAGGLDIAACTGCFKTSCNNEIVACQSDCDCQNGVIQFVQCVGGGFALQQCVTNALVSGNTALTNLIGCAANKCVSSCLPGDGGTAADAATDGAADATAE